MAPLSLVGWGAPVELIGLGVSLTLLPLSTVAVVWSHLSLIGWILRAQSIL